MWKAESARGNRVQKTSHERVSLLFKHPQYARYWFGSVVSAFGDQVGWIALIWLVLRIGGGPGAVGLVTLLYQIPRMISSPIAGVWLDRLPKARVMATANVIVGILFTVIPVVSTRFGSHGLGAIYILVALAGVVIPFDAIGDSTLVAELVPKDKWSQAYFVSQTQSQLATLLGPAVGGVLIAVFGTEPLLYIDAVTFLVCALALFSIPTRRVSKVSISRQTPAKEFVEGIRHMRGFRPIIALSIVTFFFNFLYGPFEVILPVLSKLKYGGSTALGLLWTVFSVGSVAGSLFFSGRTWKYRLSTSLASIIVLWGVGALAMAYTDRLVWAVIIMLFEGMVFSPWVALVVFARQQVIPMELQGRVTGAIQAITVGGMPLGALVSGMVLSEVGTFWTFICAGAATILVGVCGYMWPAFRQLDGHSKPIQQVVCEQKAT